MQAIGGPLHATGAADREPIKVAGHYAGYHAGATAAFRDPARPQAFGHRRAGRRLDRHLDLPLPGWLPGSTHDSTVGRRVQRRRARARVAGATARRFWHVSHAPTASSTLSVRATECLGCCAGSDARTCSRTRTSSPGRGLAQVSEPGSTKRSRRISPKSARPMRSPRRRPPDYLAGAVMTVRDVLKDPQLESRDWWHRIAHWHGSELPYPGFPFRMSESHPPRPKRSPRLGEHSRVVLDLTPPDPLEDASAIRCRRAPSARCICRWKGFAWRRSRSSGLDRTWRSSLASGARM